MVDIYVLECEGGNIYVGKTNDGERRLSQHISGKGAKWTQEYAPKRIVEYHKNAVDADEKRVFEKMVKKHGAKKVRGAYFTRRKASQKEIRELEERVGLNQKRSNKGQAKTAKKSNSNSNLKKGTPKSNPTFSNPLYKKDQFGRIVAKTSSDFAVERLENSSKQKPKNTRSSSKRKSGRSGVRNGGRGGRTSYGGYTGFKK